MDAEILSQILPLAAPIVLIQLVLIVVALRDLIGRERARGPKWAWALIICFVQIIGPIVYFVFGREE